MIGQSGMWSPRHDFTKCANTPCKDCSSRCFTSMSMSMSMSMSVLVLGDTFVLRRHADTKIIRDLHARQPAAQRYAHRILAEFVRPCSPHSRDHATHNPAMQRIVHLLCCIICYQRRGNKPRQDHKATVDQIRTIWTKCTTANPPTLSTTVM